MPYVYSTSTNDTHYSEYVERPANTSGGFNQIKHSVLIKGGTGRAHKHLVTPMGVATHVSDEDMDFLFQNEAFKRHMKKGFIKVDESKIDPEKLASDMETRDGSSPIMPQDIPDSSEIAQVSGDDSSEEVVSNFKKKPRLSAPNTGAK